MWPVLVVARDEGIEARLLLQHIRGGGFGGFGFERPVHPLVAAVVLRMARLAPLDRNAQS